jgi:CheY-like chemotaxis protein
MDYCERGHVNPSDVHNCLTCSREDRKALIQCTQALFDLSVLLYSADGMLYSADGLTLTPLCRNKEELAQQIDDILLKAFVEMDDKDSALMPTKVRTVIRDLHRKYYV